jgi:carbonic anhydrase
MRSLSHLFRNNQAWAAQHTHDDPEFFGRLSRQQAPRYLWIGCSDSRVPANEIVGLLPGEMFVHRNIANVVVHTDLNCLSVLHFAIEQLKVEHIIVVGHYGCSGVGAALRGVRLGLVDNWLRHVQDVRDRHAPDLEQFTDERERANRLCELNVLEQVVHVCQTSAVQDAWGRGQFVEVHGWVYGLKDGLLRDLGLTVARPEELPGSYDAALRTAARRLDNAGLQ